MGQNTPPVLPVQVDFDTGAQPRTVLPTSYNNKPRIEHTETIGIPPQKTVTVGGGIFKRLNSPWRTVSNRPKESVLVCHIPPQMCY
eukprot:4807875-Pyramimonas_sp.AAC.1